MINSLNSFARLASNRSEVVGASLVLLMITMMIIPLSPTMLDILIAVNITATVILLISAVLLDSPLSFSSFPAILLMTTLFRLSLSISTTRQILLEADAGEIVATFGEFVVGGNVAVGLVVFLIISVVNFLVVTKGSERVAEVAARFSLDAMPGKQMSIDGDARAGNISQEDAKKRRNALEKESQLFGAMDGAIKFVKNDAIAGLVITVINLIGGLIVGMVQLDMSFSEASHIYTILSVGDGLISIIPSLMTSIAAGLIVTRVTKGDSDGSNTAQDMIRELSANPKALQISGFFCVVFAFVPGMPTYVFLTAGAILLYTAFKASKPQVEEVSNDPNDKFAKMLEGFGDSKGNRVIEDLMVAKVYSPLEIRVPSDMEPTSKSLLYSIVKFTRNQLVEDSGFVYPIFQFKDDDKVTNIEVRVFGVPMLNLPLSDKRLQIFGSPEKIEQLKESLQSVFDPHTGRNEQINEVITLEFDPYIGRYGYFCEPIHKPSLDKIEGIQYITFEKRWAQMIEGLVISKSKEFFTMNDFQRHLVGLTDSYVELVKEVSRVLPSSKSVEVFQRLLTENVSIRNMSLVLSSMIDWGQRERDSLIISEQVRRSLFEQITHQYCVSNVLYVVSLDNEFEQFVRENLRSDGTVSFLDIDSPTLSRVVQMVAEQYKAWAHLEKMPVIVCSMDCRPHFKALIQDKLKSVPVLAFQELSAARELQFLGTLNFDESFLDTDNNSSMVDR